MGSVQIHLHKFKHKLIACRTNYFITEEEQTLTTDFISLYVNVFTVYFDQFV